MADCQLTLNLGGVTVTTSYIYKYVKHGRTVFKYYLDTQTAQSFEVRAEK